MSEVLSSWKEVATFFGKGVRTVQRWERTAGLPIHRPKPFIVLAYPAELEAWLRKNDPESSSQYSAVPASRADLTTQEFGDGKSLQQIHPPPTTTSPS